MLTFIYAYLYDPVRFHSLLKHSSLNSIKNVLLETADQSNIGLYEGAFHCIYLPQKDQNHHIHKEFTVTQIFHQRHIPVIMFRCPS